MFGEAAGGNKDEIRAVLSTVLNNYNNTGNLEKTLNMYNAYRKQNDQYKKASTGNLTDYERKVYDSYGTMYDQMLSGRTTVVPDITNFENVDKYGRPPWESEYIPVGKMGRQTFYRPKDGARAKVMQEAAKNAPYGYRVDGSPKGTGYFGPLPAKDGSVATELTVSVGMDNKNVDIPLLVPTLTRDEINYLLGGNAPTGQIIKKAVDHARERMRQGLSPYAN